MPQGLPSQSLVQVLAPELPAKLPPSASGMEFSREAEGFGGKHICTVSPGVPSSHHHQQAHPAALLPLTCHVVDFPTRLSYFAN